MKIHCKILHEGAQLPYRGHDDDVGLDCPVPKGGVLLPGPNKIPLGFSMEVPVGYSAALYPRSGMASGEKTLEFKVLYLRCSEDGTPTLQEAGCKDKDVYPNGIAILAQLPPVDPGYTGEVHAIVINNSNIAIAYPEGTRFGQLVVHPIVYAQLVTDVEEKVRGNAGFGSTGV